jgi:hypothetical protein
VEQIKRVGANGSALKYDLLTALSVAGLHGTPTEQTSLMRLNALITARYNWRLEEVSIGQAELARLWSVNERTVKREMKRLLTLGVLTCSRPGVRGRVGAYRLNYRRIYEFTRPCWIAVGFDFEDRMMEVSGERTIVNVEFQPLRPISVSDSEPMVSGTWGAVRRRLKADDGALYESWFSKLVESNRSDQTLTLRAPNIFVARYIETHFTKKLAQAVDVEMPTPNGLPRRVTLTI